MVSFTIEIPEEQAEKLQHLAEAQHTSPEELLARTIEELVSKPGEEFDQEIEVLLDKHHELLQRLA